MSSRTRFLAPRFVGKRFEERKLPLSILPELGIYETLVRDVAKRLFLQEHPNRQRVPKGFSSSFLLVMTGIEDGSSMPVLEREHQPALVPLFSEGDYFDRARDLINETISSVEEDREIPSQFPTELYSVFDRFGSSLREDEYVELRPGDQESGPHYSPSTRKALVLKQASTYRKEVCLTGAIVEADVERQVFHLRHGDMRIQARLTQDIEKDILCAFNDHQRLDVTVTGIGVHDRQDRIERIVEISELTWYESLRFFDARLKEIQSLARGWLDGEGEEISNNALEAVQRFREVLDGLEVPIPFLYPTPEGGIQAEWSIPETEGEVSFCFSPDGTVLATWFSDGDEGDRELAHDEVKAERFLELLKETSVVGSES